ncbi:gephyrin-like molybdotransferase Glp [Roseinatronobacter monicus]|uniref:Molybdopterin molybdenumtransferase n=1 Tax=Roseinatronobacter monicus TaxID=393481 RepID=A0A543K3B1_9RHOB|nr:gephyrin-like molybdotransferase Glp [Roseinatronobacter monicus]TQM89514.1 molybdopterin molybdochelatase [Roseinatronobacter monicus]
MDIHRPKEGSGCDCDAQDMLKAIISIDEALARIAAHVTPIDEANTVPLSKGLGRILAQPVRAQGRAPSFDNAAMDGYAVATTSLTGDGPWMLKVIARVPAGHEATQKLSGPCAVRIFTGAPVPDGADAVVMQEDVTRVGDTVQLHRRPAAGQNIRRAGSDMEKGATILDKGHRLGPGEIAAGAAAGAGTVHVQRRLRVALIVTGDEVREAGGERAAAQIWDVNTPMLAAAMDSKALEIVATVQGADNCARLASQMKELAEQADLIVTTGGISVGEEDHVIPAFAGLDGEMIFSRVAIKPGKPVSFGRIGTIFWLGLPGNPLSAYVTWNVFGRALVKGLIGETAPVSARRHVITNAPIHRKPGRVELRLATLCGIDADGREIVDFEAATLSGCVSRLPIAHGLIYLPAEVEYLPTGALVQFQPFCPV